MENLNLKVLNEDHATIQGREFALENRETGEVFISNKRYVDKLFDKMGYKSLGVIKILEEYAGKFISDVGSLASSKIYTDEYSGSFIVADPLSINKVNELFSEMRKSGYKDISYTKFDDCYYWDQYVVLSPTGTYFALYINLCDEYVQVLSLKWDGANKLDGIIDEGRYDLNSDDFINSIMTLMNNPIDASVGINKSMDMSYNEVAELMKTLGLAKIRKNRVSLTDEGEAHDLVFGRPLEDICDDYNIKSWIQRVAHSSGITFGKAYEVIGNFLGTTSFWDVVKFYTMNSTETSDIFMVNF